MTFLRVKKIKNKEYAYIVKNEWKKKSSRQKVKGYLGRVHRFSLKNDIDFLQHINAENTEHYISQNDVKKIISDLVEWEFFRFGIDKREFDIDLSNKKIQKKNKNVVLIINEGFMCSATLKNLVEFRAENDEENGGWKFARAFVDAGIKVPHEIFVGLFSKIYKPGD